DRTQPGLPLKKGRCGTLTHDYKRNGTTNLFAALEVLEGRVIGQCFARHRHQEFLKFLRRLDQEFPGKVPLHLVMDNYGTHKHPKPFIWTATVESIKEKLSRCRQTLEQIQPGCTQPRSRKRRKTLPS